MKAWVCIGDNDDPYSLMVEYDISQLNIKIKNLLSRIKSRYHKQRVYRHQTYTLQIHMDGLRREKSITYQSLSTNDHIPVVITDLKVDSENIQ